MEDISILNSLSWKIGDEIPEMIVDGNFIPLSPVMIHILKKPIDHKIPLVLYFPNDIISYEQYGRMTGLQILEAIKTYWDGEIDINGVKTKRKDITKGYFDGLVIYDNGYIVKYSN